jgi:O-antigen/teichoic acid export membrane protein
MDNSTLKKSAFKATYWKFAERILANGVSSVVAIILARILTPEDYVEVSIVAIFFAFCNIFISGGFNTALIQKKDADIIDYSTILISSLCLATIMYAIIFIGAPFIADIYKREALVPIFRVMALSFFFSAVKGVVCAKISSDLDFKKFFFSTSIGTAISAFIGIFMAIKGFGAWALVAQNFSNIFVDTVLLLAFTRIKFVLKFSLQRFKQLFTYSIKLFLSSLISTIYDNIRPLIVGIKYSNVDLAYYTKGKTYPHWINLAITDTLSAVLFPVMSKVQDDHNSLINITRKFIQLCSYAVFPMMLGLFATARSFVIILLTEKWLESVIYIQIFCVAQMFNIVQVGNLQAIKAIGRSDVYLKLDVIKKIFYAIVILFAVFLANSPQLLAVTSIINVVFASIVNTAANRKLFDYKLKDQIWDVCENLIPSLIMCITVLMMNYININIFILFGLQIIVGIFTYLLVSFIMKNRSFIYIVNFIKNKKKKRA